MADAGVASRRDCERLIEEGHVTVNKRRVTRLPVFVQEGDDIKVDGRPLPPPGRPTHLMVYKPARSLATTRDDPTMGVKRTTVLDLIDHPAKSRLFPVGRLEYHASGLVLLTTDGDLAHRLTHPRFGVPRTYEALVKRRLMQQDLDGIGRAFQGPRGRGGSPVNLRLIKHDEDRSLIEITMHEGPNRHVADVLAHLGCPVKKLRRTGIGPLRLTGVALGSWRELTRPEVTALVRAAKRATSKGPGSEQPRRRPRPRPSQQERAP
jgi:23S rRNA pseudouridine2605 synthase